MQRKIVTTWRAGLTTCVLCFLGISLFSFSGGGVMAPVGSVSAFHPGSVINKEVLAHQLGQAIRGNTFPDRFAFDLQGDKKEAHVQYTLHEPSQELMQKLLGQYRPDYGAFVAMDAKTGKILSMVSFSKKPGLNNLTLRASFPSASIFKVVTASAAIDMNKASPDTVVPFNGSFHTLYKRNVASTKPTRWTTYMTMREAFARSVNTFFGKLGLFYVGPRNLEMYAERYLFNHPIKADVPVETGRAKISTDDPWSVAEAASGYTRENTMSPIQGALIAAAVANDGVMMEPYLVDSLRTSGGETIYRAEPRQASVVIDADAAEDVRELFQQTVRSGTSRKSFRKTVRRPSFYEVEFGGKTGSLMGKDPFGKTDWFVGYARFRDQRIAVAALTVNEKKWTVKSSMLANLFFQDYLRQMKRRESVASSK